MSLNRNQLKYLVIVAMVIDHVAAAFLFNDSAITVIMRMIGVRQFGADNTVR